MKRLAALLFLLSGACGLVYRVVWTRMMTHVFGSTAVAVGTVLAAFMTGLALGSWLLGRFAAWTVHSDSTPVSKPASPWPRPSPTSCSRT